MPLLLTLTIPVLDALFYTILVEAVWEMDEGTLVPSSSTSSASSLQQLLLSLRLDRMEVIKL